jgi:hypothetical protein
VPDELIKAPGSTLDEIGDNIHEVELRRELSGLSTNDGTNYATLKLDVPTPEKGIKILPSPAVGPADSTKICDGKLKIGDSAIDVTAFRLA